MGNLGSHKPVNLNFATLGGGQNDVIGGLTFFRPKTKLQSPHNCFVTAEMTTPSGYEKIGTTEIPKGVVEEITVDDIESSNIQVWNGVIRNPRGYTWCMTAKDPGGMLRRINRQLMNIKSLTDTERKTCEVFLTFMVLRPKAIKTWIGKKSMEFITRWHIWHQDQPFFGPNLDSILAFAMAQGLLETVYTLHSVDEIRTVIGYKSPVLVEVLNSAGEREDINIYPKYMLDEEASFSAYMELVLATPRATVYYPKKA